MPCLLSKIFPPRKLSRPRLAPAAVDAVFYAYQLRQYSGTNAYTAAILGYVFGAGTLMTVAAPNFGGLFKKQQALEGGWGRVPWQAVWCVVCYCCLVTFCS